MLQEILKRLDEIDALLHARQHELAKSLHEVKEEREELAELRKKIVADFPPGPATNLAISLGDAVQQ
jgi:hypothetical protein